MAFKMKGMSFGKGTKYKSPQAMKKEAAMKMKKEAAMKMKDPMDMKKDPMMMKKDPMMMKKDSAMKMGHSPKKMGHSPKKMGHAPKKMKKDSAMDMKKDPMKMKKKSPMKKDDKFVANNPDAKDPLEGKEFGTKGKMNATKSTVKKDPYAEAKKRDPKLPEYIKQRQGLKKGTPEYNAVQDKINKAYGVSKRHSTVTVRKNEGNNKSVTKDKNKATGEVTKLKTKTRRDGQLKKEVSVKKDKQKGTYTKTKVKYKRDGSIRRRRDTQIGEKRFKRLVKKGKMSETGTRL
jgi:hypothetical protein